MVKQYRTGFISDIYLGLVHCHCVTHHNVLEATASFFKFTFASRWKQLLPKCGMLCSNSGECPNEYQR
jgi:hypothetical protein